jgi:hypothetical protein
LIFTHYFFLLISCGVFRQIVSPSAMTTDVSKHAEQGGILMIWMPVRTTEMAYDIDGRAEEKRLGLSVFSSRR